MVTISEYEEEIQRIWDNTSRNSDFNNALIEYSKSVGVFDHGVGEKIRHLTLSMVRMENAKEKNEDMGEAAEKVALKALQDLLGSVKNNIALLPHLKVDKELNESAKYYIYEGKVEK